MKSPKDNLLHFIGCIVGIFILTWIKLPLDTTTYIMLGVALGVEIGDMKNYGWKQLKNKATRAQYIANTLLDLFADVWGIAVAVVLIRVIGG
jgi:hypothetical protein